MVERVIFYAISLAIFIYTFFCLVRRNDSSYVYLLIAEFLGMIFAAVEILTEDNLAVLSILSWILSVVIPMIILVLEKVKNMTFSSMISMMKVHYYLRMGNKEKAIEILSIMEEKDNESIKIKMMLARIYEEVDKNKALDEYQKIQELVPEDDNISLKIGLILNDIDRKEEAKEIFSSLLKRNPDNYDASLNLGKIYLEDGEYKASIRILSDALERKPLDYDLYYTLGIAYTMINNFQKAKECYENAAQINSIEYNSKYLLAEIEIIYGELDKAEEYFNKCVEEEEFEGKSYYYLARIALIKGEINKAKNYANIAVEVDPEIFIKMYEDTFFAPIREEINRPEKVDEKKLAKIREKEAKRSVKEKEAEYHLDEMCLLVGKLSNADLEMIRNVKRTREEEETRNNEYSEKQEDNIQKMDKWIDPEIEQRK